MKNDPQLKQDEALKKQLEEASKLFNEMGRETS